MKPPKANESAAIRALSSAVEKLHGTPAVFVGSVAVHEQFRGATVWRGVVSQFSIAGHPSAKHCYAWSAPSSEGSGERFYAVLKTADIDSPEKAVRASIVADARRGGQ